MPRDKTTEVRDYGGGSTGTCDTSLVFQIQKRDDDRRLVFGWASVAVKSDGSLPNDAHGDVIDTPEVQRAWEDAFYTYVQEVAKGDDMHEFFGVADLVECCVFTPEKTASIAKSLGLSGESKFVGAWVGYRLPETKRGEDAWQAVKRGERNAFSIVATVTREELADA